MAFVFSTLSNDNAYPIYKDGVKVKTILINGKANIANKNLITPSGIMTTVSNEDLELLKGDENFMKQVKGGFMSFETKKADVEEVAKDMTEKDKSAPMTKKDIEKENKGKKDEEKISVETNKI